MLEFYGLPVFVMHCDIQKTWCWQPNYQYLGRQPYLEIRLKAKSSGWILIQYEIWTGSRRWEERWWEWHPRQRIRVMLPQAKGCWRLPAEWWSWEAAFWRSQLCLVTYFKGLTFESSFRFQKKKKNSEECRAFQTPLFLQTHSPPHQRQSPRPLEGLLLQWMDPSGTHSFHEPETRS